VVPRGRAYWQKRACRATARPTNGGQHIRPRQPDPRPYLLRPLSNPHFGVPALGRSSLGVIRSCLLYAFERRKLSRNSKYQEIHLAPCTHDRVVMPCFFRRPNQRTLQVRRPDPTLLAVPVEVLQDTAEPMPRSLAPDQTRPGQQQPRSPRRLDHHACFLPTQDTIRCRYTRRSRCCDHGHERGQQEVPALRRKFSLPSVIFARSYAFSVMTALARRALA
jgi:hypothetical protein